MKTQIALAALAVLLAIGSADACNTQCPYPYQTWNWGGLPCPVCYWPASLQCGPYLKEPYCCGGDTGEVCPAIACTSSVSYAIAGAGGCARAQSTIQATSISQSTFVTMSDVTQQVFKTYCTSSGPADWTQALVATATAAADAYAEAVAKVVADYHIFVCDCGNCRQRYVGCNFAYSNVSAQIQAVATAQAYAVVEAVAAVQDSCFHGSPALLALAYGYAESFASSTELAIKRVHKAAMTTYGAPCKEICKTETKKAIAQAVACAFVDILAAARDACTPDVTYSCSATLALAGSAATNNWGCSCNYMEKC